MRHTSGDNWYVPTKQEYSPIEKIEEDYDQEETAPAELQEIIDTQNYYFRNQEEDEIKLPKIVIPEKNITYDVKEPKTFGY